MATRVPEGTLQTSTAKNMLAAPIRDKQSEMCIFKVAVKNGAQQGSVLVPPLMSTVVSRTDANGAPIGTKWLHLCRSMPTTCLSQYVTSLRFLHHHQAGVDVVVVGVLQLHSTVIDCGRRGSELLPGVLNAARKARTKRTRADVSVSVAAAVLGIFGHFVGALVGLTSDLLENSSRNDSF